MRSPQGTRGLAAFIVMLTAAAASALGQGPSTSSHTLVYAVYDGQNRASEVFKSMTAAQGQTGERILSYAVVSRDSGGKVHVSDQRKTDAGVGAAVGAVVGLVGGPVGAAAGAAAGGSVGYLTGDAVGIPKAAVDSMKQSLTPNSSALVVVLQDQWVNDVERDMKQAQARQVIANQIATK